MKSLIYKMRRVFFLTILLLAAHMLTAQNFYHEVSVGGGFGLSTLRYDFSQGSRDNGLGGYVGLGYSYNFHYNWAMVTGLEFEFSGASASSDGIDYTYSITPTYPQAGYDFLYRTRGENFEETHRVVYMNIPLMLRGRYEIGEHFLYGAAGLRLGLPISSSHSGSIRNAVTTGYSEYSQQVHSNEPENGFSTYATLNSSGNLDLKAYLSLALEVGAEWSVTQGCKLYSGLYFNYGFTNISADTKQPLLGYQSGTMPKLNSVTAVVDKVRIMSFGVTLRFAMDYEWFFGNAKQEAEFER